MNNYLYRQMKKRDENLKYDFLPSMVEIIERPANKLVSVIVFLIIALIFSSIIWAAACRLDIAVDSLIESFINGHNSGMKET